MFKKTGDWIKKKGQNLTNKVTVNKSKSAWKAAYNLASQQMSPVKEENEIINLWRKLQ